ncbi:ATP synthase subunit I [Nicoletella semolina]|uniref:ATP synthase subunit I n=1 Tax=Nicoletella semolina TaxID=271160 RepID=UPI001049AB66
MLLIETMLILAIALVLIGISIKLSISFFIGSMGSFFPFVLSVFFVFFRKNIASSQKNGSSKTTNSAKVLYQSELLKWATTIVLFILVFTLYQTVDFISFFAGYFFSLLCNTVLPILIISRENKIKR